MNSDIVSYVFVGLIGVAIITAICYFNGWFCDGGRPKDNSNFRSDSNPCQQSRNNVDNKLRGAIRKMVAAESEAYRLAVIATRETGTEPHEYIESLRSVLFPPSLHFIPSPTQSVYRLNSQGEEQSPPSPIFLPIVGTTAVLDSHGVVNHFTLSETTTVDGGELSLLPPSNHSHLQLPTVYRALEIEDFEDLPPSYDECVPEYPHKWNRINKTCSV